MKRSRLIAFLLTAMMLLSTAATGVFATDEIGTSEPTGEVVLDNPAAEGEAPDTVDGGQAPAPAEGETAPAAKSISVDDVTIEATKDENDGKVVNVIWTTTEDDKDKVTKLVAIKDGETAGTDFSVSDSERSSKAKSITLEYNTTYTIELWMKDGEEDPTCVKTSDPVTTGEEPIPAPAAPTLYAYPTYHAVYLAWTPSANATQYVLVRNDGVQYSVGTATSFTDTNNAADTTYSYYVVASNDSGSSPASNVASAARVRTCYYRITFKKAVKLTSHDGTKTKHTFQKGQVVYADGFAQGMYQFDFEGHRYHAKWMRIKSPSGDYARNAYENGVTPTLYVNQAGFASPTGYLIWISIFSQRVYVFQGSAGNWTLVQNWQCGSGKAKTPTPTGINKSLHKKMKKYSKHKWWNCFSGNNAIHGSNGQKEIKKLGKLISNGCVRVTNDQAIWIFNTVPKGTRVVVF